MPDCHRRRPRHAHGNGLTGLAERLQLADGRLETGPGAHGGFTLRALAPLSRGATPAPVPAKPAAEPAPGPVPEP